MLKVRIIPTLLFKNYGLVKGEAFDTTRRIGDALQFVRVYNVREVDELVFLDITATNEKRGPDFEIVDDLADECFMPLTVGGGVRTVEDVRKLLQVGADKVSINTTAVETPELVKEVSDRFGSQCIVVSIDFKKVGKDGYEVFTHSGTVPAGLEPAALAARLEKCGAGEILLTSIDRDGTMLGYELECIRRVSETVSIPVIASGGAGNFQHMFEALSEGKASAVGASAIFSFTEQTPLEAKHYLRELGIPVRL